MVSTELKERVTKYGKAIIIIGCIAVACYGVYYCTLGIRTGNDISNDIQRVEQTVSDIQSARDGQQAAINGLEDVEGRVDSITDRINTVEDRIDRDTIIINAGSDLIKEGKRILDTIRERTEKETKSAQDD